MTSKSNTNGRGFEFACLLVLKEQIAQYRAVEILENGGYHASKVAWEALSQPEQERFKWSIEATIPTLFALEPNILDGEEVLELFVQDDKRGETADIRDIVLRRGCNIWEVGFSVKHNHVAVKHSRLARSLDFGARWYGVHCSPTYWQAVTPIFEFLELEKRKGTLFSALAQKEEQIYEPLLKAFIAEISKQVKEHPSIPQDLVRYLLGKFDFYKIISHDIRRLTTVQAFNMYGFLNLPSAKEKPTIKVQRVRLPSHILYIDFKFGSRNTVLLVFDNGWQFSFRIHNASSRVEPSLKFDIQLEGIPAELNIKYHCAWDDTPFPH